MLLKVYSQVHYLQYDFITFILAAKIPYAQIKSLGISTQRATFVTWKKDTGECLHNFITWKDLRAREFLNALNASWRMIFFRFGALLIYWLTRNKKFGMGSKLKIMSSHVSGRFLWVLQNIESVKKALKSDNLMFGTLETWLIYKLTGSCQYVTDISNASATGFYDPFDLNWGTVAKLLRIPVRCLPMVVENDYDFGNVDESFFGVPIKIACVMADQSSSMIGSCCFANNDLKITLGTGAFLNVNTADKIQPSLNGMYPLIAWQLGKDLVYMSEVPCPDAGSLVEWLQNAGFICEASTSSQLAASVEDSDGVFFIPAFSGLGPPISNENAGTGFIGIKPTTRREHIVRAVLESIVYRMVLCYDLLKSERNANYNSIRVDGGLSNSSFICQSLADMSRLPVTKMETTDITVLGVAYLSGLKCGFWSNKEDLTKLKKVTESFEPTRDQNKIEMNKNNLNLWIRAARRFYSWY
ncbi:unnamed protein product [Acanthoscelides obtectus]|uniref:Glycerol kinase n=1 Tax=Acanthoscelides obtectus TaxID=200917 RepID=A0A9P0KAH2_ACAOB|nr:unnamed protein product [Acanthoscelides obtectus]CAK1658226.1 Putative glycerol kinase 5 [Acanthoscelides obtectus]